MILLGIALEIALHFTNKNKGVWSLFVVSGSRICVNIVVCTIGWPTSGGHSVEAGVIHYVYVGIE